MIYWSSLVWSSWNLVWCEAGTASTKNWCRFIFYYKQHSLILFWNFNIFVVFFFTVKLEMLMKTNLTWAAVLQPINKPKVQFRRLMLIRSNTEQNKQAQWNKELVTDLWGLGFNFTSVFQTPNCVSVSVDTHSLFTTHFSHQHQLKQHKKTKS